MSVLLLAQLVAPPLQQGPVRLPETRPGLERPAPRQGEDPPADLQVSPEQPKQPDGETTSPLPSAPKPAPVPLSALPAIDGLTLYSRERLRTILASCSSLAEPEQRLQACATALQARLIEDGYVNSRVFVEPTPTPGRLQVVEGRLVEVRVSGNDSRLNRRVTRLLRPLQGSVLHLPSLQRQLQLLRRVPGVKQVRGTLNRLGSDASQASLGLALEGGAPAWQGDISIRNDGNSGSGDARAVATIVKPGALMSGDTLLLYGELNSNDEPELGAAISSLTYTLPLGDAVNLTAALGASRRNLIELQAPADGLSTDQVQGLAQLEWVISESLSQRWSTYLGYSGSSSRTELNGEPLPSLVPSVVREPRSGYLRLGVSGSGIGEATGWVGSAFLLQGIAAAVPAEQRQEWQSAGLDPADATAVGALISAGWAVAPGWQLSGRLAGQWAFNPLLPSMQFSLGSDVGLRGLPGQLVSGDSGWLAVSEVSWSFWQNRSQTLQLVPFVGAGGVRSELNSRSVSDTVGSAGLLLRWLTGENWAFELGWVNQFTSASSRGPWNDWVLDDGLYARAQFRF